MKETIERITEMEQRFDRATEAIQQMEKALKAYKKAKKDIRQLTKYFDTVTCSSIGRFEHVAGGRQLYESPRMDYCIQRTDAAGIVSQLCTKRCHMDPYCLNQVQPKGEHRSAW